MQKMNQFIAALLLTGICSTACEREESTKPTSSQPSFAGARLPCGLTAVPATYDPHTGKPSSFKFQYVLCQEIPWWKKWWWVDEIITPRTLETLPRTVVGDFRQTPTRIIDQKVNSVLFGFAENAIGMQLYQESRLVNQRQFTLTQDLVLTAEQQQVLGVRSNVVSAGIHPVIYDSVNKTYNVILFTR